jgi:hypothetical protein
VGFYNHFVKYLKNLRNREFMGDFMKKLLLALSGYILAYQNLVYDDFNLQIDGN